MASEWVFNVKDPPQNTRTGSVSKKVEEIISQVESEWFR